MSERRVYTPAEFSAELLSRYGKKLGERAIARRCRLPVGHRQKIARLAAFPGRHFIPADELERVGTKGRRA